MMTDDRAVHAVADAIARGMHEVRGEHFTDRADFDAWRVKVATWAVEAARPIIEAEVRAADGLTSASCYEGDHDDCNIVGPCQCECHDVYASRAAVRTEPIEDLMERSSFGTPEARGLRESVSDEDACEVVRRAAAMNPDLLRPPDRARPGTEPEQ